MSLEIGIILAFIAMLCWGFGDFLIQKSTRKFGNWETLFLITLFGAIVLLPFVYKDIPALFSEYWPQMPLVIGASAILLVAALLDFEALKQGKLSVVEPIWSLEVPVSALLAFFILQESISFMQSSLIAFLIAGLFLVSLKTKNLNRKAWLEKGAFIALL